jgi:hypothetical protein
LSSSYFWTSTSAYERPTLPPDHDRSTSLSLVTRLRLHLVGSTAFERPTDFPPRTTTFRFYLTSSERATSAVLTPSTAPFFVGILGRANFFGLDSVDRTPFRCDLTSSVPFATGSYVGRTFSVLSPSTVPFATRSYVGRPCHLWPSRLSPKARGVRTRHG